MTSIDPIACPKCGAWNDRGPANCDTCGASLAGGARVKVATVAPGAVRITDVDIPIGSIVNLMLKVCVAFIPVVIMLGIIWGVLGAFLFTLFR